AKRFLDDLLRYGKPRPLDVRAIDAAAEVALAVSNVRAAWNGEVAIDVTGDAPRAMLDADRSAFVDVVTNLVHNACIAVEGREGKVRVHTETRGDALLVIVEDDGAGVPRELEATLFQPFVTGRGRDAKHPGTGLGLAIA